MSSYKSPNVGAENQTTETASANQSATVANTPSSAAALDDVKSANLAANVASSANLSVANSVYSQSISVSAGADLGQYNASTVSKTQITDLTSTMSVLTPYTVVEGDTVPSIATKFGVSDQTIRWANNLTTDAVAIGSTVTVPAVDGVVYTVKANDNLDSIASKYKSDVDSIMTVNDLDDTSVTADTKLLLPGGVLPENEQPGYRAPASTTASRNRSTSSRATIYVPISGGNRYAYGYCTWYAYNRRVQLGRPIPSNLGNANTWAKRAAAAGYRVDRIPEVGAIMQNSGGWGGYGHVAIVEKINADGTIVVSEMNGSAGWNRLSTRTVPNPGDYNFIH
jgi:surface antigen